MQKMHEKTPVPTQHSGDDALSEQFWIDPKAVTEKVADELFPKRLTFEKREKKQPKHA